VTSSDGASSHGQRQAAERPRRRSHLTPLTIVLAVLLSACSGADVRGEDGRVVAAGLWSVFDLRPGDCIGAADGLDGAADEVPLVPCAEPHTQEVFAVIRHPENSYPGAAAVATFADRACLTALEFELDLTIDDGIAFSYLMPTREGWDVSGHRSVACVLVFDGELDMTGSFVDGTADPSRLAAREAPGQG